MTPFYGVGKSVNQLVMYYEIIFVLPVLLPESLSQ